MNKNLLGSCLWTGTSGRENLLSGRIVVGSFGYKNELAARDCSGNQNEVEVKVSVAETDKVVYRRSWIASDSKKSGKIKREKRNKTDFYRSPYYKVSFGG